MKKERVKKTIEAALFMSPEPLTVDKLKNLGGTDYSDTLKILEELKEDYDSRETSLKIDKNEERFEMTLKDPYLDEVGHLATVPDLKKAELRTLGLIAIRQPIKQSKVAKIIGNKAYKYVGELERRGFVETAKEGQTRVITATDKFKKYFGEDPEELKERI